MVPIYACHLRRASTGCSGLTVLQLRISTLATSRGAFRDHSDALIVSAMVQIVRVVTNGEYGLGKFPDAAADSMALSESVSTRTIKHFVLGIHPKK